MLRAVPASVRYGLAGAAAVALAAWPGTATEKPAATPDFSGLWARMTFGAEPPPSGPGPIVNRMHRASDGAFDGLKLVGDDSNPILKPAAAEQVRKQAAISIA